MSYLLNPTILVNNHTKRTSLILIMVVYLIGWFLVYLELPIPLRVLFLGVLVILTLQSLELATILFILVTFFPFFNMLYRDLGIAGFIPSRVLFFPYLLVALSAKKQRDFPAAKLLVALVLISIISIKISADFRTFLQEIPPRFRYQEIELGFINLLVAYFDLFAKLFLVYFTFTRLSRQSINDLFKHFLLILMLEGFTLMFIVYKNPEALFVWSGPEANRILWNNPYFGHKNDWGMMFSLLVGIALVKIKEGKKDGLFSYTLLIVSLLVVGFSLSRQAYLYIVLIMILLIIGTFDLKILFYSTLVSLAVIIIQPEFLINRMETSLTVSSTEEVQSLNRKFSGLAADQIRRNLTVIPRMFYTDTWEYNWSEGFWNGMLHQQGLIGLAFHTLLYLYLLIHYLRMYFSPDKTVKLYGLLGIILSLLLIISHFSRQTFHFIHYNGMLTSENLFNLLVYSYIEFIRFCSEENRSILE